MTKNDELSPYTHIDELKKIWEDEEHHLIFEYIDGNTVFYLRELSIAKKYKSLSRGVDQFCKLTEKDYKTVKKLIPKIKKIKNKDSLRFILEEDYDVECHAINCNIYRKMTLEEFVEIVRNGENK